MQFSTITRKSFHHVESDILGIDRIMFMIGCSYHGAFGDFRMKSLFYTASKKIFLYVMHAACERV